MKIKIILGMLLLVVLFPFCKKETPTEPVPILNLHIEGFVTEHGRPSSGVYVALMEPGGWAGDPPPRVLKHVYSDEYGRYSIKYGYSGSCYEDYLYIEAYDPPTPWYGWYGKYGFEPNGVVLCTEKLQTINIEFYPD